MSHGTASADGAPPRFVMTSDGEQLAWRGADGRSPTVVFLGGFSSDMTGTKAVHLESFCRRRGQRYLRFDYRGHGASSGRFEDGTIGAWRDDALAVIEACTEGPLVLVGSSMGAWIMLLVARELVARVHALVGIAAAADFTEDLVWRRLSPEIRERMRGDGALRIPTEFSAADTPVTLGLIEEARRHLLLRGPVEVSCPVRLLHGGGDRDVPWPVSLALLDVLEATDVTLTLVKSADHSMSEPDDLCRLERVVEEVLLLASPA